MAITFEAENIDFPKIKKRETANWIKSVTKSYGKQTGDISYLFCTDEKILEVNRSTIQRRRHAGLEFIKKFMEEET